MRLDDDACRELLGSSGHGVLGTLHTSRGVDAVPVVFVISDDAVVIPIDTVKPKAGRRLQRLVNLEADDRAVLLVDHFDDDWSQLWWVRVHGPARESVPDPVVLAAFGDAFPAYRGPGTVTSTVVLRIGQLTGWRSEPGPA